MSSPKIVFIGAGSHVFAKTILTDCLSFPELRASEIVLVDVDQKSLDITTNYMKNLVAKNTLATRIESTTKRETALSGADYVIDAIRVGGFDATKLDIEIPAKYGVIQGGGVTVGAGGVFYGLRNVPAVLEICRDMEDKCPKALLLNYTDPLTTICWAINDYTKIKNVGLCNGIPAAAALLEGYLQVPTGELSYLVAGINHFAWFLTLEWRGEDMYPKLRHRFKDPAVYSNFDRPMKESEVARAEIFKAFGYFPTEGSQHTSEFVPYFRKRQDLFQRFRLVNRLEILQDMQANKKKQQEEMIRASSSSGEVPPISKSREYCGDIIHSIETGKISRFFGNVSNTGLISNLPNGSCVEVPCLVDASGIHPCYVGDLPPQCAALDRTNLNVEELAAKAAAEKDKTLAFQALLLDPLTSAILTIDEIKQMVDEMFEKEAPYLPQGFRN